MCDKCSKQSCGGCNSKQGASSASATASMNQLSNQVAELQDQIDIVMENAKFLLCGHPIMLIEHADDINQFDLGNGVGLGCWDGWAICDGGVHYSKRAKKNITTPNFTDRFIVQAGGEYAVDDTGGADTVTLTVPQLPSHNHAVTDPGHDHTIVDPGHDHAVTDPGHVHGGASSPHVHTFTTDVVGGHEHSTGVIGITDGGGGTGANVRTSSAALGDSTSTDGSHTHTGTTNATSEAITIAAAFTGIDVTNAFTGITETENANTGITVGNTGGGLEHENRPPFFATLYIMKL